MKFSRNLVREGDDLYKPVKHLTKTVKLAYNVIQQNLTRLVGNPLNEQ